VVNNPLIFIDPFGLIWGVHNGDVQWFKDKAGMEAAGFQKFMPKDWTYKTTDGKWVALNPDGPGSCDARYDCSNDYFVSGWAYTSDPSRQISDGGVQDVSLDFYLTVFGGASIVKNGGEALLDSAAGWLEKRMVQKATTAFANQASFKIEGQLAEIFADRKLFLNWLRGNQSLSRMSNPLNAQEAQQLLDNAEKLGMGNLVEGNLKGLQGLEKTGQWANIPHFKIGNVHIPIEKGLENVLKLP
jgi:hypothetical protein